VLEEVELLLAPILTVVLDKYARGIRICRSPQ